MKIMKFGADWCPACNDFDAKMTDDILSELKKMNVDYEKFDIDSADSLTYVEHYKIKSIPTVIVLNDDYTITNKYIGAVNFNEFMNNLRALYNGNKHD